MKQIQSIKQQSSSPSFGRYSSETLADIAARVIQELHSDTLSDSAEENDNLINPKHDDVPNDFEFSFSSTHPDSSPVSADDIFYNGQIRPIYPHPLFDSNSLNPIPHGETPPLESPPRRLPLRKLMLEDRETPNDSSVPAGPYCVWTPSCKKSVSTRRFSLKRWKLRDLLNGSHSDGKKESLRFLSSEKRTNKVASKHASADNNGASRQISWVFW
ncbi:uncharacterized protein LOC113874835 [Abrus precatorius]|uniref:Uncharacterized protein LOC113874835 n=1 Tax=Abrus precatorius TaxID=3816 RepID=A0A8B8MNQ0_ABRPR|nr:uncharacterized protein LOC113874835 [Abrus precatorius]